MTSSILNMRTGKIKQLQEISTFKDREPGEVLQFIEKSPFPISLLLEVPDKVREFFPDAGGSLKVNCENCQWLIENCWRFASQLTINH